MTEYVGPSAMACPYVFTGNAGDDYNDFFVRVWQWAEWVRTQCDGEMQVDCEVMSLMRHAEGNRYTPEQARDAYMEDGKEVCDGITLKMGNLGWQATAYGEFVMHVLAHLPSAWPDGDIEISIPCKAGDVLLHLWHD